MLFERQSRWPSFLQISKTAPIEPPLHALHPASSWQPPLPSPSFSPTRSTELVSLNLLKIPVPHEDIDRFGESVSRKKRRLRHELVTSRLSRPYATPATHIARGAWRLGVWARQRSSGGLLLRKGAILNSIAKKRKKLALESTKKIGSHGPNTAPMYGNYTCSMVSPANSVRSQSQASLKPLSVFTSSDYDAFDYEENDPTEDEEDEENNANDSQPVYSDFRMLASSDSDEEFGDASYSFDTLDTSYHLGIDHRENIMHLVIENERQREVSVAPVRPGIFPTSFPGFVAVGL